MIFKCSIWMLHVCPVCSLFFVYLVQSCFHFPAAHYCLFNSPVTCHYQFICPRCALFPNLFYVYLNPVFSLIPAGYHLCMVLSVYGKC